MLWLLEPTVLARIQSALKAGNVGTLEEQMQYEASARMASESGPPCLTIAGDVAEIAVSGILTRQPDFWAWLFGDANTTYTDMLAAIATAESDSGVERIVLRVNSPGGNTDGLFEVIDALQETRKPITTIVEGQAASAAYGIAAQGDEVIAATRASAVGSIGVVASFFVSDSLVEITSTDAPNKRPDVRTEEGQAEVRTFLDEIHDLFASSIAAGRGVDVDTVNAEFGRGSMMLAERGMRRGMIDSIAGTATTVAESETTATGVTASTTSTETPNMDLETLKAEHPGVYAQAVADGEAKERDRVSAHLKLGEAFGAMPIATKAIVDGTDLTPCMQAEYMTHQKNQADAEAREDDDASAAAAADGADSANDASAESEQILKNVAARFGRGVTAAA